MSMKTHRWINPHQILSSLTIFFVITIFVYPINSLESRRLDDSTVPGDQGIKCTPSCIQNRKSRQPNPPPPILPSPSSFIYIPDSPGNVYSIDQNFGGANRNVAVGLLGLVCGFSLLLAF
ncbi:hypothetical protein ES288_A01G175400v1 [Gossypium darwinii]|uniref:Transmembrane protein n=1 Tax=Gossypium darwinii TaxID=34276 RepID=A0A5D2HMN1_GOSDA|nr:hypothetical protein ES288_A01G175400v1 [Gossypium darwinii]